MKFYLLVLVCLILPLLCHQAQTNCVQQVHQGGCSAKHTVWLDCDPGLDDTMALILAAKRVSTSAGNTNLESTFKNALDILYNIGRSDVEVVRGSDKLVYGEELNLAEYVHGEGGLGGVPIPASDKKGIRENGFQHIRDKIMNHPSKIIWANTGALTNLCLLIRQFPQLLTKIQKIVIMGGAIGQGNITPAAQFNVYFDPAALKQILQKKSQIPLIMIPLEITHTVQAKQPIFDYLQKLSSNSFVKAILNMLKFYQEMYKVEDFDYPPIHDPTVINYILHPNDFVLKNTFIDVDIGKTSYGRTNCYFAFFTDPNRKLESIDYVGLRMKNRRRFWGMFEKIFKDLFEKEETKDGKQEEL